MNALSLYVTTCRMVLQSGADDASAWADISRLLSCLRQALTCCVCEKILTKPTSSSFSCHHNVCQGCLGGKMRVKPQCGCCTDFGNFTENAQVRIVLQCYKKLCEYIVSSALHRKWGNLNGGTTNNLAELVQEGAELPSDHREPSTRPNVSTAGLQDAISDLLPSIGKPSGSASGTEASNSVFNGNGSVYSVTLAKSNSTKIMIKRTNAESSESDASNFDPLEGLSNNVSSKTTTLSIETAKTHRPKKQGCCCGLTARNPGQLTCCGQKCLCYVDRKACSQCRCRGCRNPNKYTASDGPVQNFQPTFQVQSHSGIDVDCAIETNGGSQS